MTSERDDQGRAVEWKPMTIHIERMHLEEDAGKNVHEGLPDVDKYSYVDLNRAGTPLGRDRDGAGFQKLVAGVRLCQSCKARAAMGRGERRRYGEGKSALRGERFGQERSARRHFGIKSELKNLNSVRFMQKAIEYEIERQIEAHEKGEPVMQETRLWDEKNQERA